MDLEDLYLITNISNSATWTIFALSFSSICNAGSVFVATFRAEEYSIILRINSEVKGRFMIVGCGVPFLCSLRTLISKGGTDGTARVTAHHI